MEPFKFWRCDVCGEQVGVADGYVVWNDYTDQTFEFKVIHKAVCDDKTFSKSGPIDSFLGPDGLVKLTAMLSYGRIEMERGFVEPRSSRPMPTLDAWVDFVRRVQVPNYEEVRLLYSRPETWERMSDCSESYPYLQRTIHSLADDLD